jgi:hypothetical protein
VNLTGRESALLLAGEIEGRPGGASMEAPRRPRRVGLSEAHIRPRVEKHGEKEGIRIAKGGSLVAFRARAKDTQDQNRRGGGRRGVILGMSRAAARRFLEFVNGIDLEGLPCGEWIDFELTFPGEFPTPKRGKRFLMAFRRRFERRFGKRGVFGVQESQLRGAPHYHLLANVSPAEVMGGIFSLREWCAQTWYDIVGSGDERHLRAGTSVTVVNVLSRLASYCANYCGKAEQKTFVDHETGEVMPAGRFWFRWNRAMMPSHVEEVLLTAAQVYRFRRQMRRLLWARRKARHRTKLQNGKRSRLRRSRRFLKMSPVGKVFIDESITRQVLSWLTPTAPPGDIEVQGVVGATAVGRVGQGVGRC